MDSVLFCIPLKDGSLEEYHAIMAECVAREQEYREMLQRYDLHAAKVWVKNLAGKDYAFIYHEVGPNFEEKLTKFGDSAHPFDQWIGEQLMSVYEADPTADNAKQLIDFMV